MTSPNQPARPLSTANTPKPAIASSTVQGALIALLGVAGELFVSYNANGQLTTAEIGLGVVAVVGAVRAIAGRFRANRPVNSWFQ